MSINIPKSQIGSGNENKKISLSLKPKETKSDDTQKELNHENTTNGHDKSCKANLNAPKSNKSRDSTTNSIKENDGTGKVMGCTKEEQLKNNKQDNIDDDENNKNGKPENSKCKTVKEPAKKVINAAIMQIINENEVEVAVTAEKETEEMKTSEILNIAICDVAANIYSKEANADNKDVGIEVIMKKDSTTNINSTFDEEMPNMKVFEADKMKSSRKVLKLNSSISDAYEDMRTDTEQSGRGRRTDEPKYNMTRTEQNKTLTSLGRITGRRSFKDLPDLPIRKYKYELCTQSNIDLDNTSPSMNATIGPEVTIDYSFSFFGIGKKREQIEATQPQNTYSESENGVKPPKRARTDANGIINLIKTPITLLRSQFFKTSMHFSTPNIVLQQESEGGVEDVSATDAIEDVSAANLIARQSDEVEFVYKTDKEKTKNTNIFDSSLESFCEESKACLEKKCDAKNKTCNVM